MQTDFISYLLDDHFGIVDSDAGEVIGDIGFVGDLASVSTELILGTLMDLVGRKIPSIAGLILAASATLATPFPKKIGWIYAIRCLTNVGTLPLVWSPFSVDYVDSESLGLYSGFKTVITQVASILGSTVAI